MQTCSSLPCLRGHGAARRHAGRLCRGSDNPYARIQNPPLVRGTLHTVTAGDSRCRPRSEAREFEPTPSQVFPSNYPDTMDGRGRTVERARAGGLEPGNIHVSVATAGVSPRARGMPLAAAAIGGEARGEPLFRNVLGSRSAAMAEAVEEHATVPACRRGPSWSPTCVRPSKRLREAAYPVMLDPVAMTTAYLGDHRTMAIRAPDGALIAAGGDRCAVTAHACCQMRPSTLPGFMMPFGSNAFFTRAHEIQLDRVRVTLQLEHLQLADAVLGARSCRRIHAPGRGWRAWFSVPRPGAARPACPRVD